MDVVITLELPEGTPDAFAAAQALLAPRGVLLDRERGAETHAAGGAVYAWVVALGVDRPESVRVAPEVIGARPAGVPRG
jgi:hypothetical protein